MTQKPLHQAAPETSEYWANILVLSFSPREKLGPGISSQMALCQEYGLWRESLKIPTGLDVVHFALDQYARTSQLVSDFLQRARFWVLLLNQYACQGKTVPGLSIPPSSCYHCNELNFFL